MNSLKKKEGDFLRLLLSTSNAQRRALLNTINKSQLYGIVQIVYNVLVNNRILPDNDKKILTKHKRIIRRFVSKGIAYVERKRILQKYYKHISKFLKVIQSEL
jgi:hypothetical protein